MNEGPLSPNLDGSDTEMLDRIQKETFEYYVGEVNAANGLVADSTQPGSRVSRDWSWMPTSGSRTIRKGRRMGRQASGEVKGTRQDIPGAF